MRCNARRGKSNRRHTRDRIRLLESLRESRASDELHRDGALRALEWAKDTPGAITKTGNSHLRHVLVESAWHYRHQPKLCKRQKDLQSSLSPKVAAIGWSAQQRLHRRYRAHQNKSKPSAKNAGV